jgi:hypothetical protein
MVKHNLSLYMVEKQTNITTGKINLTFIFTITIRREEKEQNSQINVKQAIALGKMVI